VDLASDFGYTMSSKILQSSSSRSPNITAAPSSSTRMTLAGRRQCLGFPPGRILITTSRLVPVVRAKFLVSRNAPPTLISRSLQFANSTPSLANTLTSATRRRAKRRLADNGLLVKNYPLTHLDSPQNQYSPALQGMFCRSPRDPGAYTKEQLATLHSQIVSNLEQAWEITGRSEDQLSGTMMQISHVVAQQFNKQVG